MEQDNVNCSKVKVSLPDGSTLELCSGITVAEAAAKISPRLASKAVLALVDGEVHDLHYRIESDCNLALLMEGDERSVDALRHTAAHIMAQAVRRLFPNVRLAIGPAISTGFYYDFDKEGSFSPEDLEAIEKEMRKIIAEDLPIVREEMPREQAIAELSASDEVTRWSCIELPDDTVSFYRQGEFKDLCRGPHMPRTGLVKAFKLLNVAGAYWRGDENRQMLSRIYGTAFPTKAQLDEHLRLLEEAAKRDHRKLGRELDLFSVHEEAGAGLIFYHEKGAALRTAIEEFWRREHVKRGYKYVITPHIAESTLWDISGHNSYYRDNMYFLNIDEKEYVLKPMNCPGHILIYQSKSHSYREMPIRYCELGTVYRYERSGVLHGLLRVRGFTQDDAHLFCTPSSCTTRYPGSSSSPLHAQELRFRSMRCSCPPGLRSRWIRRELGTRHRCPEGRPESNGSRPDRPRRGRVLRAEDRHQAEGRPGQALAGPHHPGGLQPAREVRRELHRPRRREAQGRDDPPRGAGLHGALPGLPDRALRRRLPGVDRPGAGQGDVHRRAAYRVRQAGGVCAVGQGLPN